MTRKGEHASHDACHRAPHDKMTYVVVLYRKQHEPVGVLLEERLFFLKRLQARWRDGDLDGLNDGLAGLEDDGFDEIVNGSDDGGHGHILFPNILEVDLLDRCDHLEVVDPVCGL